MTQRGRATRQRIGDAALRVLGTEGVRALTHARVDTVAGLPRGSTSNHHRSRAALLEAAVARLVDREQAVWEEVTASAAPAAGLAEGVTAWLQRAVTTDRELHLARYALSVEARADPEVLGLLRAGRARVEAWVQEVLLEAGAGDPAAAARLLLAHLDGTLFRLVTGLHEAGPQTWEHVRSDLASLSATALARPLADGRADDRLPSLPG